MKCVADVCLIDLIYGDLKAFHLKDISTGVNHMIVIIEMEQLYLPRDKPIVNSIT